MHPTDFGYGYQYVGQAFARTLNEWIPYHRIACMDFSREDGTYPEIGEPVVSKKADYFTFVAALSPFMCIQDTEGTEDEILMGKIWKRAADLMVQCDYYPLSKTSKKPDQFCVNQYYRPEEGKGYIQAVRHTQCQQEVFRANLRDIEDEKTYIFDDMKTGQLIIMSGKALNENGFHISLKKREAVVWFYEEKGQ